MSHMCQKSAVPPTTVSGSSKLVRPTRVPT
jgi:hypothetical protein